MMKLDNKFMARMAFLLCGSLLALHTACKDPWKDDLDYEDKYANRTLLEAIRSEETLSAFYELLVQTGYDAVLAGASAHTVWAPSNLAIEAVDNALLSDTAWTRSFVGQHIAALTYAAGEQYEARKIVAMNGKTVSFDGVSVSEIDLQERNLLVSNGVLHVVGQAIRPKQNIWEMLEGQQAGSCKQIDFIKSRWGLYFDEDESVQIGVNEDGLPVYDSVFTRQNSYLTGVARLDDEMAEFTYLILADDIYEREYNRLTPFFQDTLATQIDYNTNMCIVRDVVIEGRHDLSQGGSYYTIRDSTVLHINPSMIVSRTETSNGVVYFLRELDYEIGTKLKPTIVQGEFPFQTRDGRGITRRTRLDNNGKVFQDLLLQNHGVNAMWIRYRPVLYSGKYNVYWRVVRDADIGLTPAAGTSTLTQFPMKVTWGEDVLTSPFTAGLGYVNPPVIDNGNGTFSPDYEEHLLGQVTVDYHGYFSLYLVGNTVNTNGLNTLLLDYIRLEPVY